MRPAGLGAAQAVGLLVVALLSVAATWFLAGLATTLPDIPPSGPACRYDVSGSVGPVMTDGREEVAWGLIPKKQCVGSVGGVRIVDDSHTENLRFFVVGPLGPVVGVAAWWVGRRRLLYRETSRR